MTGHIAWAPACGSAWCAESVVSGSVVAGFGLLLLCVADGPSHSRFESLYNALASS